MNRIIDGGYQKRLYGQTKPSDLHKKLQRRSLKAEREAKKENRDYQQSQSEKLVKKLLANADKPRQQQCLTVLEDLLMTTGIMPSAEEGLITNLNNLTASGDGSILKTAASHRGKPTCDCRKQGIYKCDHPRDYTSETAEWCYNSAKKEYIFGDRYYLLATTQNGHDYPLEIIMPGGNESDFTLSLKALDRFQKVIREHDVDMNIDIFSGDGHHDSNAHYKYLAIKGIKPVIPLDAGSKTVYPHLKNKDIKLNENGDPICPGGLPMHYMGYNKNKHVHTYNCPAKRGTHRGGKYVYITHEDECPNETICQPESSIGPCVYIKSDEDPRLFPPIPRKSKRFKEIYNQRTATERENWVLDSYNLDGAHRCAEYGLIRLTFSCIIIHAVNWYNEQLKTKSKAELFQEALDAIMNDSPTEHTKSPPKPASVSTKIWDEEDNLDAFWNL